MSDRIALTLVADEAVIEAVHNHAELIKGETLSLELHASVGTAQNGVEVGDGQSIQISVAKL